MGIASRFQPVSGIPYQATLASVPQAGQDFTFPGPSTWVAVRCTVQPISFSFDGGATWTTMAANDRVEMPVRAGAIRIRSNSASLGTVEIVAAHEGPQAP